MDDGSRDRTAEIAVQFTLVEGPDSVRLLKLHQNSGKGAAVRKGALRARGEYILMADADGATRASDFEALFEKIKEVERDGLGIAIGSRAHMDSGSGNGAVAKRSAFRRLLMGGFHAFVSVMVGGSGIKDTQCGFKLFTRQAARELFSVLHIERWAFDVELVYLGARKGIPMVVRTHAPQQHHHPPWSAAASSRYPFAGSASELARDGRFKSRRGIGFNTNGPGHYCHSSVLHDWPVV